MPWGRLVRTRYHWKATQGESHVSSRGKPLTSEERQGASGRVGFALFDLDIVAESQPSPRLPWADF